MKKITTIACSLLLTLMFFSPTNADIIHKTNIKNYFAGPLWIKVTLYTGEWEGETCLWEHAYNLTSLHVKMYETYPFLLDSKQIEPNPHPQVISPTCGELRFTTDHEVQKIDKFRVILNIMGFPKDTDPHTVTLTFDR